MFQRQDEIAKIDSEEIKENVSEKFSCVGRAYGEFTFYNSNNILIKIDFFCKQDVGLTCFTESKKVYILDNRNF